MAAGTGWRQAHSHALVHAIAAHWGFTGAAHFSRLFQATYGTHPQDYRNLPSEACTNRQHPCAD
ncbi:AraC family transcriptional regulator [Streptomyces phaeochromogenes]|uniref:AraC family transcriptional regulator n=1 Tax=Streptomyces phaeochromogenes TaxID=1923 RepID=UPI002E2A6FDD|nr:AraC family transcriptional regulator [Streptomyces phaeochromogenes]